MADEGDEVVFRKKAKRAASARSKKSRAGEADDEEEEGDLQDRILGAQLEQKMRKRVKGLAVTETSDKTAQARTFRSSSLRAG